MKKRLTAILAVAAMVVTMVPSMVFADTGTELSKAFYVEIGENEHTVDIVGLQEILNNAEKDSEIFVCLEDDVTTGGLVVPADKNLDVYFELMDYTWTLTDPTVGSAGTETLGFQLNKGNDVTFSCGSIKIAEGAGVKMLIQNYCNLTLMDVSIDGTNGKIPENMSFYTLSNNSGSVVIMGETYIKAPEGQVAFDVCKFQSYELPSVLVNTLGIIDGKIEVSEECTLNLSIVSGRFTEDVSAYIAKGAVMGVTYEWDNDKQEYTGETGYTVIESENYALEMMEATYKVADGENVYYFTDSKDAEHFVAQNKGVSEPEKIAYRVTFYAISPTGEEDVERTTYLTIPAEYKTISEYLKVSEKEIQKPTSIKGYKFTGWYAAESYDGWTGEDDSVVKNLVYSADKADVNAELTDDAEYFAAWEKVAGTAADNSETNGATEGSNGNSESGAVKTGDDFNALPFGIVGLLAMAGAAAVVFTRKREN